METKETSGLVNGHPPKVYTTFEELEKIKIKLEQRKKNGKKNNLVLFAYKNNIKNKIRFEDDKWFCFDRTPGNAERQTFGGDIENEENLNILAKKFEGLFDYISSDWGGVTDKVFKTIIKLLAPEGVFAIDLDTCHEFLTQNNDFDNKYNDIKNFRGCLTFIDNSNKDKLLYKVVKGQSLPGMAGGGSGIADVAILKQLNDLDLLDIVTENDFPIMSTVLKNWEKIKIFEENNNNSSKLENIAEYRALRKEFKTKQEEEKKKDINYNRDMDEELKKLIKIPVKMWSEPNFKTPQEYFSQTKKINQIFIMKKVDKIGDEEITYMTKKDEEKVGIQPASLFDRPWEAYPTKREKEWLKRKNRKRKKWTCYNILYSDTKKGGRKRKSRKRKSRKRKSRKRKSRKRKSIKRKSLNKHINK
jgi:hypothetical protein